MIVTFTKLLTINIVAKVRSESSRKSSIDLSADERSESSCDKSLGDRLKNAISEPLAMPERKSSPMVPAIESTTPKEGATKCTSDIDCNIESMSIKMGICYYLQCCLQYLIQIFEIEIVLMLPLFVIVYYYHSV